MWSGTIYDVLHEVHTHFEAELEASGAIFGNELGEQGIVRR